MAEEIDINSVAQKLSDKEDFIVFAGAGAVAGTGVADSWEMLMSALAREAEIDISGRSKPEYPDIAQGIYEKIGHETYDNVIREQLRPTEVDISTQAIEIIETTNWVVTTNFDNIIENTYLRMAEIKGETPNLITNSLPQLPMEGGFNGERLIYLHGSVHSNHIVFRRDQYDHYYPSVSRITRATTCLEEYLKFIYTKYMIVFVGFSFIDRYVRGCFINIHRGLEWQDEDASRQVGYKKVVPKIPQHYAFIRKIRPKDYKDNESYIAEKKLYERIEKEMESVKIKFVWYDDNIEWIHCFRKIKDEIKSSKVVDENLIWKSDSMTSQTRLMSWLKSTLIKVWKLLRNAL